MLLAKGTIRPVKALLFYTAYSINWPGYLIFLLREAFFNDWNGLVSFSFFNLRGVDRRFTILKKYVYRTFRDRKAPVSVGHSLSPFCFNTTHTVALGD
jgi:hypothetical protein